MDVFVAQVISYSAAIHACEKGWLWQEALKFIESMTESRPWRS